VGGINFDLILKLLLWFAVIIIIIFFTIFLILLINPPIDNALFDRWVLLLGGIASAIVAFVAIIAIFKSDKQTKKLLKSERERRSLDEIGKILTTIAEWATRINNCGLFKFSAFPNMTEEDMHNLKVEQDCNKLMRYAELVNEGSYLNLLANYNRLDNTIIIKLNSVQEFLLKLSLVLNIQFGVDLDGTSITPLSDEYAKYLELLKSMDASKLEEEHGSVAIKLTHNTGALHAEVSKAISVLYA